MSLRPRLAVRRAVPALVAALALVTPSAALAQDDLRLGVYPWGAAGATGPLSPAVPENANESMRTVQELRGGRPFVVHLYGDYTGVSNASVDGLLSEASWWSANGLEVSAVLRYRPADSSKAAGYPAWVRTQVRRLAALPGTRAVTIGNEPNNPSAGAGDGSYPGVLTAIANGIPAARAELDAAGRSDVKVGFNWAAGMDPARTEPMWASLRSAGGGAFTSAVGFVGVNVYPGTWSPPSATTVPTSAQIDSTIRTTLGALRGSHMPAAGVGDVPIVIEETGYPTGTGRTEATQDMVLRTILSTVDATRATYGVTGFYAFALRDGNTASGQLENGYGLLRDDYSAKPAFTTFRSRVAGSPVPPPTITTPTTTTPTSTKPRKTKRAAVSSVTRVLSAKVRRGGRRVDVRVRVPRRASVTKVTVVVKGGARTAKRTVRVAAGRTVASVAVRVKKAFPRRVVVRVRASAAGRTHAVRASRA